MSDKTLTYAAGPILAAITAGFTKTIGKIAYPVDVATLSDQSLAYLAEYGYNQSMGDTKALSALEKAKQAEKAGILPEGFTKDLDTSDAAKKLAAFFKANEGTEKAFDDWEAAFLAERAQARHEAILAGEMVFGSSERLSPEEKDRREIVLTMIRAAVAAAGKKMPKEAEVVNRMIAKVYEQKQAEVDKEVARRAKTRSATSGVDLGEFI